MSVVSRLAARLEHDERLDPLVRVFDLAAGLVPSGRLDELLRGRPLGHALHPVLTDAPLGFWFSASALDVVGGHRAREAATRLVGLGIVAAAPTALAGLADWRRLDEDARRVGAVHALVNDVALALYASSWLARRRGRHTAGALAALAGAAASGASGYLGGHLVLTMKEPAPLT
jgi:uncharacterized membrane protein